MDVLLGKMLIANQTDWRYAHGTDDKEGERCTFYEIVFFLRMCGDAKDLGMNYVHCVDGVAVADNESGFGISEDGRWRG